MAPQAAFQRILEGVGHRHQFDVGLGAQRVDGGAGAASAAADQGDLDRIVAGGMRGAGQRQRAHDRRSGRRG